MFERDLLVACVACVLGSLLLFAGIANRERFFESPTPRALAARVGRMPARWILALAGAALIAVGGRIFWGDAALGPSRRALPIQEGGARSGEAAIPHEPAVSR